MLLDEYVVRRRDHDGLSDGRHDRQLQSGCRLAIPSSSTTTCCTALFAGVYLQDEWKILPEVTINYGARFDEYYSSFDKENQPSPRVNVIYQPTDSTTLHAGYARYFTPPPVENVPSGNCERSSTARRMNLRRPTHRTTRSRPSARIISTPAFQPKNHQAPASGRGRLLQDRQAPARRRIVRADAHPFGVQLCARAGFMAWNSPAPTIKAVFPAYANLAWSQAQGKDWNSAQFLFDPNDAGLRPKSLDLSGPRPARDRLVRHGLHAGRNAPHYSTRVYTDALYGSGLRRMAADMTPPATRFPTARACRHITPSTSARSKVSNCPRTRC